LNKKTKGLITGVVGASLLLGTAGTFALWYDSAALGADDAYATISTGNLEIQGAGTVEGNWVWETVSHSDFDELLDEDATGALLVPGDIVVWEWNDDEAEFALAAILEGHTLVAELILRGFVAADIQRAVPAPLVVTVSELPEVIDVETFSVTDLPTITIAFPEGHNYGRNIEGVTAFNLSDFTVTLEQVVTPVSR
jgi:alternate signal-mediated exported protein